MAITTSGPISFLDIANEFGRSTASGPVQPGLSLGDYYQGGAFVPAGTAAGAGSFQNDPYGYAAPAAIPGGGAIQMSQFFGTTKYVPPSNYAPIVPFYITEAHGTSPSNSASCNLSITNSGIATVEGSPQGTREDGNWKPSAANAADYELYWTSSGTSMSASSTKGTWINLANGWFGGIEAHSTSPSSNTNKSVSVDITIRQIRDNSLTISFSIRLWVDTFVYEN